MEAILPFKIKNEQKFFESALKVGFDEIEIYKFIYVMQISDLDIFPKMHDERINMLIYGWELCEDYKQKLNPNDWELPEEMETILKLLVPWSLDIWFSKEWDKCKYFLKSALIHCLNRARDLLMRMPDMMQINWDFLLLYNLKPWNVLYLINLTVTKEKTLENGAQCIETEESPATDEDISYVKLEQLPIIVLRLVKIFDQSSIDMVKTLCMRVIAAWNKIHQTELETSGSRRPYVPPEDKKCLMLICHIYLMAVYESDDVKGYVIDNMINNIRFYYQGFQNSAPLHAMRNLEYTPARYIALTNIHLRIQKRDFFDFFIWNKYDTSLVNLFGVVSQAYKSYLLGNLLMELNNMNEDDFALNIPLYKRLMNSYVNEREKSELFLLNELNKIEAQRYAHNIIQTVKNVTDFKSKICKGNRMSNIGNYENSDDTVTPLAVPKSDNISTEVKVSEIKNEFVGEEIEDEQERVRVKESELRLDPIFQNLPNNESILYYVYDVLAKKDYKGWHFAKVVLLMKIIGREQNMIETWRYHPGLTTDFMLNLEVKLSHHYVDLAKIFKDHPFLEQEFWLTAFYLNPTSDLYETIKRLGMRNNRKRTDEQSKLVMSIDNIEAKYGLLSSTIDVKELATMSNTDDPITDYEPLFSALHSLSVPDSLVKDMLTVIFLPRNRSFAWAVDWVVLRNRCKMIMTSSKEKKRFVDLNMAEANERLKYLIIDYEKYKNRPQLDYGTIEEGYENLMTSGEFDKESEEEEEEEEEEEDFEDDEDVYESKKRGRGGQTAAARKKEEEEKVEDDNSQEDDPFLMGKRRTRARTAATLASFLFQTLPRSSRRKKNLKSQEDGTKTDEEKTSADNDDKSSGTKSPITTSESPIPSPLSIVCSQKDTKIASEPTKNMKECLNERPTYLNTTQGFQTLVDIWNVEESDLQSIDENCVSLMESSTALQIAVKLKSLNKEINPLGCDEKEYIDDMEMIIHNAEFAIKKEEFDLNAVKVEGISDAIKKTRNFEKDTDNKGNVQTDRTGNSIKVDKCVALDIQGQEESIVEQAREHDTVETDCIKVLLPAEQKSSETKNSDMTIAARKDSGVVSESHTKDKCQEISSDEKYDDLEKENKIDEEDTSDARRMDEISLNDNDIKMTKEPQETGNEEVRTQEIKDNDGSSGKKLITEKALEQLQFIPDTIAKDVEKLTECYNTEENTKLHCKELNVNLKDADEKWSDIEETFGMQLTTEERNSNQTNKSDVKSAEIFDASDKADGTSPSSLENETEAVAVEIDSIETNKFELDAVTEDSILTINSSQESTSHIFEEQFTENKIEDIDKNTKRKPQLQNYESNIRYISNEELNKTTDQFKLESRKLESATTNQSKLKSIDGEKDGHIPIVFLDDTTADSIKTTNDHESADNETQYLKNLCLTKCVKVLLHKLRPEDIKTLRQPRIKIQRINYDKYAIELRAKRRRIEEKVYLEIEDSSNSNNSYGTNTSSSEAYRPIRVKRKIPARRHSIRQPRTSESDNESNNSNNSDDFKLSTIIAKSRKRRLSTPSTSKSSACPPHVTGPKLARKTGPKFSRRTTGPKSSKRNLIVTPRSASGLKLRISNAEQNRLEMGTTSKRFGSIEYDEVIQLSSSSSDECILNDLTAIEEEVIELDHPLFEEEIII